MGLMENSKFAYKLRKNVLKMISAGKSSHIGSALSIADIITVLYNDILKLYPDNIKHDKRDRFILSKGHAGASLYSALAQKKFFALEELDKHYQDGSKMSGHISHHVNGVELSTGSLGQGSGVSAGIALGLKKKKNTSRVFCLLSDGELNEGSTWEAIMFAAHHKLDNLTLIIDANGLQSIKTTKDTMDMEPLRKKFEAFNFQVNQCDGHNYEELKFNLQKKIPLKPSVLIADTTKGKGVSFMENQVLWHYKAPNPEELELALKELKYA